MKKIFVLILIVPSLCWGLKFEKMSPDEMKKTGWVNYYPFFKDFNQDQTYTPLR